MTEDAARIHDELMTEVRGLMPRGSATATPESEAWRLVAESVISLLVQRLAVCMSDVDALREEYDRLRYELRSSGEPS